MSAPRPAPPTLPMAEALARSSALGGLLQRVRDSEARWQAVRGALPAALADQVRPGPLDDEGWTLLVPSGAAAAKLRQCLPNVQAALDARAWPARTLRVKVQRIGVQPR